MHAIRIEAGEVTEPPWRSPIPRQARLQTPEGRREPEEFDRLGLFDYRASLKDLKDSQAVCLCDGPQREP
jgi:hypothetical protein